MVRGKILDVSRDADPRCSSLMTKTTGYSEVVFNCLVWDRKRKERTLAVDRSKEALLKCK